MIDFYCERTASGLFDEPLNLVTNLAFVLAGLVALRRFLRQPGLNARNGWDLLVLIGLMFAIGVGSGLFHAFASGWTLLADVIPITLLINVFLLSALVRIVAVPWWSILLLFAAFQGLTAAFGLLLPMDAMNGSVAYLPPLMALVMLWTWCHGRRLPSQWAFLAASLLFCLSLTFRTLDAALCPLLPIGTHFLWHLLNALVLYLLVSGLMGSMVAGLIGARCSTLHGLSTGEVPAGHCR